MHQLIILGNGFDLTCGLKSKFSDFYSDRTHGTSSIESIPEDERNVWDVILSEIGENNPLWCNIERLISAYVFQEDDSGSRLDHMYEQLVWTIDPSNPNRSEHPDNAVYNFVSTCLEKDMFPKRSLLASF